MSFLRLLALLALVLLPCAAQEQEPRLRVAVDLVSVDVSVTDARGQFVRGLRREQFRVLDDGAERPVTQFFAQETPASVLVLVETSPAVYLLHRQHLLALRALLESLAPDDEVALATYDRAARLVLPFTRDKTQIYAAASRLHFSLGSGELRLYASLEAALGWLAGRRQKKSIVLLSTGLDSSSEVEWQRMMGRLREESVTVHGVALGGNLRDADPPGAAAESFPPARTFAAATRGLREMCGASGGQLHLPRREADFEGIYRQVGASLRNLYALGFTPAARDARYHSIEILLLDNAGRVLASSAAPADPDSTARRAKRAAAPRFRLTARPGYLAPSSEPAQ